MTGHRRLTMPPGDRCAKDALGNVARNAERREPGARGASEIVQGPKASSAWPSGPPSAALPGCAVQADLHAAMVAEGCRRRAVRAGEDMLARRIGMSAACQAPRSWWRSAARRAAWPAFMRRARDASTASRSRSISAALHAEDSIAALHGQDQQLDGLTLRRWTAVRRAPDFDQFCIAQHTLARLLVQQRDPERDVGRHQFAVERTNSTDAGSAPTGDCARSGPRSLLDRVQPLP